MKFLVITFSLIFYFSSRINVVVNLILVSGDKSAPINTIVLALIYSLLTVGVTESRTPEKLFFPIRAVGFKKN